MRMKSKLFLYCCFLLLACNNSSESSSKKADYNQQPNVDSTKPKTASASINENDLQFDTLQNIEQITFCLPYPSSYMKEDFEQNDSRAKHVFVSKNKKGKMILQGLWSDLSFEEIYKNHHATITKDYPNAEITTSFLIVDNYAICWLDSNTIFYVKNGLRRIKIL